MSKKDKKQSEFWKKAHFKYRISAINENTLEEVWKMKASMFSGAVLVLICSFLLITITAVIIITTPIRYYLPGYMDVEIREKATWNAIKIDSLEQALRYHDAYVSNIKKVLAGTLDADSIIRADSIYMSEDDPILEKSQREKEFVAKYEEEEKYTLGILPPSTTSTGALFYKPITGVLLEKFDPNTKDYGVKIKTNKPETVYAVLEGVVMFTSYDLTNGYVIQIQHKNGFTSIYKGCSSLVKKVGDKVNSSEAIGVLQERGEGKGGLLTFELWNKGVPSNPENVITF